MSNHKNRAKLTAGFDSVNNSTGYELGPPKVGDINLTDFAGRTLQNFFTQYAFGTNILTIDLSAPTLFTIDTVEIVDLATEKSIMRYTNIQDFGTTNLFSIVGDQPQSTVMVDGSQYLILVNEDIFPGFLPETPSTVSEGKQE